MEIAPKALWKAKPKGCTVVSIPSRVEKIGKFAFGKSAFKKVILQTTLLTKKKRVRLCLKSSNVKTVKSPRKSYKKYKKVFVKKNVGKKVKVTR